MNWLQPLKHAELRLKREKQPCGNARWALLAGGGKRPHLFQLPTPSLLDGFLHFPILSGPHGHLSLRPPSLMELQRVFGSPNILKPLSPIRKMSYPHHLSLEGN